MIGEPSRADRIVAARRNFVLRAQEDKDRLLASYHRWCEGAKEELAAIRNLAHRLRGTAGSFGFLAVSKVAADLEIVANDTCISKGDVVATLQRLITELERMQADNPS